MRLITHDGSFHADDVIAYTVLSGILGFKDAKLVRTRDADVIASAGVSDIVFDVGFVWDPLLNRFDHHMRDKPLRQETHEGEHIPYSSVGLVWRLFGEEYLLARFPAVGDHLGQVWDEVDRSLIMPTDNGVGVSFAPASLSVTIDDFNMNWDDDKDGNYDLFFAASAFAQVVIEKRVRKALAAARAHDLAFEAMAKRTHPIPGL